MKPKFTLMGSQGYRETLDGKYYLLYLGETSKTYQIGRNAPTGNEHLEDVQGFNNACKRLNEIIAQNPS